MRAAAPGGPHLVAVARRTSRLGAGRDPGVRPRGPTGRDVAPRPLRGPRCPFRTGDTLPEMSGGPQAGLKRVARLGAALSITGVIALVPLRGAAAGTSYGNMSLSGAITTSESIAGGCSAHSSDVGTTVSLRTERVNGTTLAITGSAGVPAGAIDLAHTATFNVEVQIVSGTGAGGSWLAGLAGPVDVGSGTLSLSTGAVAGSVNATLAPYGGSVDKAIQLKANWNCGGSSLPSTGPTTPLAASPASTLMSRVPPSLFGCTSNPNRDLGGANVEFRYNAIAEVDCEPDGVGGVDLVVYLLYPSTKAMNAAFEQIFVEKAARPRSGLGCTTKTFLTAVCAYRVGESTTPAGSYVRFFFAFTGDPHTIPAIAWTSDRYDVIAYTAGDESNDTQDVYSYWASGKPNPV
jgi:hypothetical protein